MKGSNEQQMAKVAINKSLLKEYRDDENPRIVYLNDGDEFQIQLFNPCTDRIAASISIDGEELQGMVVIRPGERVWLERYLDKARKFRFSTYEVEEGNAAVDNAIRKNGVVTVRFYHQDNSRKQITIPWTLYDNNCWKSTPTYGTGDFNLGGLRCSTSIDNGAEQKKMFCSGISTGDSLSLGCTVNYATNISADIKGVDCTNTLNSIAVNCAQPATKETGRVESGSYSSQSFKNVDYDFQSYPFKTETIRILPASRKQFSSKDLQKIYCTNCGRKLNTKYKYCPYCGHRCE